MIIDALNRESKHQRAEMVCEGGTCEPLVYKAAKALEHLNKFYEKAEELDYAREINEAIDFE